MLVELARTALNGFRLDLAARVGVRAVALLEALEGEHAPETLEATHRLGIVCRAVHDLPSAERHFRRAAEGFTRAGMADEATEATIDLAKALRDRGSSPVAETMLLAAIDRLRRGEAPNRHSLVTALGNLAQLYGATGRPELADRTYDEALDAIDAGSEQDRPWILHARAVLKQELGRYDEALELYSEARRVWEDTGGHDHPFVATTLANIALVHWALGDPAAARAAFSQSAVLQDRGLRRMLAIGSERERLAYAGNALGELSKVLSFQFSIGSEEPATARLATELLLQRKGRVLDGVAHTFMRLRQASDPEDQARLDRLQVVRTEIAALVTPTPVKRRVPPAGAALARLRAEEEQLETTLSHRGALLDPDLEPVTVAAVQQALPPDAALVEYVRFRPFDPLATGSHGSWGGQRYAACVVRTTGEPEAFDLGPAEVIDAELDALRRLLRSRSTSVADCDQKARELHTLVIAPLGSALTGARRLLVAPDGKLSLIPFGLLQAGDGVRLADAACVSYLTSGRELLHPAVAAPEATGVVVVADPDFDADVADAHPTVASAAAARRGPFASLPGSKREAADLAEQLDAVTVITGPAATVDAVKRLQHPLVLHIATHGFLAPRDEPEVRERIDLFGVEDPLLVQITERVPIANPMFFSGVALAGANRRAPGTGTGILSAQELAGIDLHGTQLVVLSACETGLGTVERGEEFVGLRRALSIAGARTLLTSLWRVNDEATRTLMSQFYAALLEGLPRAEALGVAQGRVAGDPDHPEWQHPFYWAAFVLSGDWTPMPGGLSA